MGKEPENYIKMSLQNTKTGKILKEMKLPPPKSGSTRWYDLTEEITLIIEWPMKSEIIEDDIC